MAKRGRPKKNDKEDLLRKLESDSEEFREELLNSNLFEDEDEDEDDEDLDEDLDNENEYENDNDYDNKEKEREVESKDNNRSEYSYNENKSKYDSDYDIDVEYNENAEDTNDYNEQDDEEIVDKDYEEEEGDQDNNQYERKKGVLHPYLTLLQTANIILSKIVKKELTFDKDEMKYLDNLFWQAYPSINELSPKTVLFLTLGQIYASKLLL